MYLTHSLCHSLPEEGFPLGMSIRNIPNKMSIKKEGLRKFHVTIVLKERSWSYYYLPERNRTAIDMF